MVMSWTGDVCHFDDYIDLDVVHDFFAGGWRPIGTPYDPTAPTLQQLSGYVRPGLYGIPDVFFTYPACGAVFLTNGWESSSWMGCSNTGTTLPVRHEFIGAWFFRPL
jgi:hypothetical protein